LAVRVGVLLIAGASLVAELSCGRRELQSPTSPTVTTEPGATTRSGDADAQPLDPEPGSAPQIPADSTPVPTVGAGRAVLIGAGDFAQCGLDGVERTGQLMERLLAQTPDATIVTFGDNSNDDGSRQRYDCFDRSWGRFKGNIRPSPGNHDYDANPNAPYYYEYFPHAGPNGVGFYSYDRGNWHIVVLNSELEDARRPAQISWLDNDLQAHPTECTLAYFHRPYWSSGEFAAMRMRRFWDVLYRHGVDVVANGHEHFYAAFPPMAPDGARDSRFGIRQLVAGTGGARLFATPVPAYGERIIGQAWGLLRLTLDAGGYSWDFIDVNEAILDHGEDRCHGQPAP
jgi:calcineurin-like phosphoesterase family protein